MSCKVKACVLLEATSIHKAGMQTIEQPHVVHYHPRVNGELMRRIIQIQMASIKDIKQQRNKRLEPPKYGSCGPFYFTDFTPFGLLLKRI